MAGISGKGGKDCPCSLHPVIFVLINAHARQVPRPLSEPETYAMLLVGLGLLGFIAGRRKTA